MLRDCARLCLAFLLIGVSGCSKSDPITETEAPVATTVALSPATLTFSSLGESQSLTATVTDQSGAAMSGVSLSWTSSADPVANVTQSGLVTAINNGAATITATAGSATGSAVVTVQQVAVSVTLSLDTIVLPGEGATQSLGVTAQDAGGSEVDNPVLVWAIDAPGVATVDQEGLVTAVSSGEATVTAASGSAIGTVGVFVHDMRVVSSWDAEGDATDSSGGNDGTLMGGASFAVGVDGQGFLFDGVDDFVLIGNPVDLQVSDMLFAVSAWVRADSLGTDLTILGKMSGVNQDGWRLLRQFNDRFWFCLGGGGGVNGCTPGAPTTVMSQPTESGRWYHVVAVRSENDIAIYLDGALGEKKSLPIFADSHAVDLLIGAENGQDAFFYGMIDEVKVFAGPVTPLEMDALFPAAKVHRPGGP